VGGTSERGLSRPVKAVSAAVLLAGLLAVVALAARGGHPGSHGAVHQREVPARVGNDLLTILLLVYGLWLVVLLVAVVTFRGKWKQPRRPWWRQMLILLVVFGALTLLGYRAMGGNFGKTARKNREQLSARTGTDSLHPRKLPPALRSPRRPAEFDWVLAGAIGGGLLLVAIVVLARRRGEEVVVLDETVEEELVAVVSDTIDDLRREADPRRAVIAAYARMERVLRQHGLPRRPSEAPFEYLARVLGALRVRAGAVHDLTELFERAKFSSHEIDVSMKERAIGALVSVRDDLEAAVPA
jgi:hypothetical protein